MGQAMGLIDRELREGWIRGWIRWAGDKCPGGMNE